MKKIVAIIFLSFLSIASLNTTYAANGESLADLDCIANFCRDNKLFFSEYTPEQKEEMLCSFILINYLVEFGIAPSDLAVIEFDRLEKKVDPILSDLISEYHLAEDLDARYRDLLANFRELSDKIKVSDEVATVEEVAA